MNPIAVGADAPDFKLMDQDENEIKLSDFKGKKVLLSWHPLAFTSVCTDQMRALENSFEQLKRMNTVPLGLSVDPAPAKKAWATSLAIEKLRMPSDFWPHGKVAKDYGIFDEEGGYSTRANIIIDENGKVKWVKVYTPSQLPDMDEVFQALSGG